MSTFRDAGWVWEGLGFDPGIEPSIYGVGEGAAYFGLDRANFMFHRNNRVNLSKLNHLGAVVPEISKWKWVELPPEPGKHGWGFANWRDSNPETVRDEAENLSRVSLEFPNISGAIIDDTSGIFTYEAYNAGRPQQISEALHCANPDLKLWLVVYTHQLDDDRWQHFLPFMDVVNLWVWECASLPRLEEYVSRCAEVFPGKEIIVGSYIRDYPTRAGVPLDLMAEQYGIIRDLLAQGRIGGYSILAGCLIDMHPPQAEYIRAFIDEHSAE
ncbi:MAG: hypothetical protein HN742_04080 [Lentisphaerae bacterium]|jgi:hypothetical protein|nr:hypothetical protein [Lentisphaerota bacterium]MBT4817509.1 hypothetical protein [Lentisphaerota bacterium]MBT5604856.1 hypothetical protein [Lentisphaerota bacterium]MBT7054225.1 hypothetical protein [Lentisphaerota bacterium]MBT7841022.1 hypothetical protein [Lentisphaerota bacterium]